MKAKGAWTLYGSMRVLGQRIGGRPRATKYHGLCSARSGTRGAEGLFSPKCWEEKGPCMVRGANTGSDPHFCLGRSEQQSKESKTAPAT